MASPYRLKPLEAADIDQAFPLVRIRLPRLLVERWRSFAAERLRRGAEEAPHGIMTVQSPDGYIYGLFCYAVAPDLEQGWLLAVDHVLAAGPAGPEEVLAALVEGAEDLARKLGCAALRIDLDGPLPAPSRAALLALFGGGADGLRLRKRLISPASPARH